LFSVFLLLPAEAKLSKYSLRKKFDVENCTLFHDEQEKGKETCPDASHHERVLYEGTTHPLLQRSGKVRSHGRMPLELFRRIPEQMPSFGHRDEMKRGQHAEFVLRLKE